MPRWGMVIDLDKCTACQACVVACQEENNVPFIEHEEFRKSRAISWMHMLSETHGEFPNAETQFLPRPCLQCDNPPCIKVCPVRATYINDEGIVGQVYGRCIGCRFCVAGCPYTAKYFNWYPYYEWQPESSKRRTNPDVSVRPKGVVEKCTFCHHRLMKLKDKAALEGRSVREGEFTTACSDVCPSKAITFGDLDNPESKAAQLTASPRAFTLLKDLGTKPKVVFLTERK
ncbi:MAG: 4Fe-4S dicluster domain-containing protein [Deltaproteobacteria bacterium]|nr:4Fe-4S dicluster domain-containing protein [Deltaproteobacteria bacterium]